MENIFKNTEKLQAWLKETVKYYDDSKFSSWLADVERIHGETGSDEYEVSRYETNSGNPETYNYKTKTRFFLDDEEVSGEENDFDEVETTYIF